MTSPQQAAPSLSQGRAALAVLERLDLGRPGLAAVRQTADADAAATALLAYYRTKRPPAVVLAHEEAHHPTDLASAEALLRDEVTLQGLTARLARRPDGGVDWVDTGPAQDREWAWFLNRHLLFTTLVRGFRTTGDERFARAFDAVAADWLAANLYAGGDEASFAWRPMEAATRMLSTWPSAFYGFRAAASFADATRLAMLASVADHADCLTRYHRRRHNHAIKEMAGLVSLAVHWPEFRDAADWLDYGLSVLDDELAWQLYPDGTHKELCAGYHGTVLGYVGHVIDLAEAEGQAVPARLKAGVQAMLSYFDGVRRPNGRGPHNNDSDDHDLVAALAERGHAPGHPQPPSCLYPWAGHLVMRSDWSADAQWAFFDVGPAGTAKSHVHRGRLHLSVSAHGRDLLVDSGRYWYRPSPERDYFTGSAAHNVLLVDGCGQKPAEPEWSAPQAPMVVTDALDYARGRFDAGFGGLDGIAVHERTVIYVKPRYWLVVDHLTTDRPRAVTALWHIHPDCTVAIADGDAVSTDAGGANLRLHPLGPPAWRLEVVCGRAPPDMQGWWSPAYNEKRPSPTVVCRADIDGSTAFAWLITTAAGPVPPADSRRDDTYAPEWLTVQVGADRLAVRVGGPPSDPDLADLEVRLGGADTPFIVSDAELLRALHQEETR